MQDTTIALAIAEPVAGDIQKNLDSMEKTVEKAAYEGAGIVCFPEMNLTGYTLSPKRCHIRFKGAETTRVADMAERYGITILFGGAERGCGDLFFASHFVASPGLPIMAYRKLHIPSVEKDAFVPGKEIPVFSARGVKFGIQLCYDAHFPELSTAMAEMGAEVIFMPHASPFGTASQKESSWMRHLPARAYDNALFIAAVNQNGPGIKNLLFPGIALVLGPDGRLIKRSDKTGILFCDLTAEKLDSIKRHRMRYFLKDRRIDLFGRFIQDKRRLESEALPGQ